MRSKVPKNAPEASPASERPLRVLFDGYWWAEGPFSNQQVQRELILGWARQYPDDELLVVVPAAHESSVRQSLPPGVRIRTTRLKPHGIAAIFHLPFVARRLRVDITVTHNFTPLFGRSAVFIHDLLFVTNPEWFTRSELAYFSLMPATMSRAAVVLTSSASEASRIDRVGRARRPVVPIGLGVPPGVTSAIPEPVAELDGISSFALIVGRLNVRKNLGLSLEAALDASSVTPEQPIVVVGEQQGRASEFSPDVRRGVEDGRIRFAGFVTDAQLAWLYREASVFIFMSLDEGFGLPNVEAMSFGTPIVASDIPVFREIVGDRGTLVDPTARREITVAIEVAMRNGTRPEPVEPASLGYDWDSCSRKLREAVR